MGTFEDWLKSDVDEVPLVDVSSFLHYVRSGTGFVSYPGGVSQCGSIKFVVACSDHPETKRYGIHSCSRLQCPVCLDVTVERLAGDVSDRMLGLSACLRKNGVKIGRNKHVVFTIPVYMYSREEVELDGGKALYKEFYSLLNREWKIHEDGSVCEDRKCKKKHSVRKFAKDGFYGGVVILHLERKKHADDGTPCDRKGCKRPHVWVWGPHFHYIGYGFFEDSVWVWKKTDWIYEVIEDQGKRVVFDTVKYLLTHCATFVGSDGKQVGKAIRWVGVLSNSKGGKKVVGEIVEYELCPVCKEPMHKYGSSGTAEDGVNWAYDQGVFERKVEVVEWYLVKKGSREEKLLRQSEVLAEWCELWR
jgi:hypothetical protein